MQSHMIAKQKLLTASFFQVENDARCPHSYTLTRTPNPHTKSTHTKHVRVCWPSTWTMAKQFTPVFRGALHTHTMCWCWQFFAIRSQCSGPTQHPAQNQHTYMPTHTRQLSEVLWTQTHRGDDDNIRHRGKYLFGSVYLCVCWPPEQHTQRDASPERIVCAILFFSILYKCRCARGIVGWWSVLHCACPDINRYRIECASSVCRYLQSLTSFHKHKLM